MKLSDAWPSNVFNLWERGAEHRTHSTSKMTGFAITAAAIAFAFVHHDTLTAAHATFFGVLLAGAAGLKGLRVWQESRRAPSEGEGGRDASAER